MRLLVLGMMVLGAAAAEPVTVGRFAMEVRTFYGTAQGLPSDDVLSVRVEGDAVTAFTRAGAAVWREGRWAASEVKAAPVVVKARDGRVAEGRPDGLFVKAPGGAWTRLLPRTAERSWAPMDVRGVVFDTRDRLWFASPQGVGVLDGSNWTLYMGRDGLPYDDFTCVAAGEDGVVWFGTRMGAIRFDGQTWEYREGLRWLPDDEVRAIAVDARGDAWIATSKGLARIERRPMTLEEKARFYEAEIDKRHRRTPYQFVHPVVLTRPGDLSEWTQVDSDNDGLWTSMYGAGECFAYGATGSEEARRRAKQAFEALRFLGTVTQGGGHPAPKGFVARSILPVSGPDPNLHDSPERDLRNQQTRDKRWKVIVPRWPKSEDGQWYWKTDTSSDELDGHYFFYGLYYDLVAKTEEERSAVRAHVAALTDHLVSHNFQLVDHDGKPTRWSIFNPEEMNMNRDWWQERGMNSLSMLAYLKVAEHITGDAKYGQAARMLVEKHGYGMNLLITKTHLGLGAGNQSDDEMIFMNFYSFLKYEKDPDLRKKALLSFRNHWENEAPELNPLFNFLFAAVASGQSYSDAYGTNDVSPTGDWLAESVDTLKRMPLDRVDWRVTNHQRKDLVFLTAPVRDEGKRAAGYRVNGKVLPVDERYVGHWNHDPWALDQGGQGRSLGDGGVFLLPYYMGVYCGFIR